MRLLLVWIGVLAACSGDVTLQNASCEVVSSADGQTLSVSLAGTRAEIRAGAQRLVGEGKADKRVYHEGGPEGAVVLEVKAADTGFKLRTAASALLWKVRYDGDKIKVSDNDDNERAWTIKLEPGGEGKVRDPVERVTGRVVHASGVQSVNDATGQQAFAVRSGPQSIAYGALLLRDVPETERRVIVAELLARGK